MTLPLTEPMRRALATIWIVLRTAVVSFLDNRAFAAAATLSLYGFLALMPLLLAVVLVVSATLDSPQALTGALANLTREGLPNLNLAVVDEVQRLAQSKAPGWLAFILLLWAVTPFAGAARAAFEAAFHKPRRGRHFWLFDLGWDALVVMLLLSLILALMVMQVYLGLRAEYFPHLPYITPMLEWVIPLLMPVLVIGLLFLVFSPQRPRWSSLLIGSLAAAFLFNLLRWGFGALLVYNPDYGYAFGSLKTIFLLLVWAYYSFAVLLFGAEVAAAVERREILLITALISHETPPAAEHLVMGGRYLHRLDPGEHLFEVGDAGREMYVVVRGEVIVGHGGKVLTRLHHGDFFGEMSLLRGTPRSTGAKAGGEGADVVAVDSTNFEAIVRENPAIFRRMLEEMANRLQATTEQTLSPISRKTP